MKAPRLVPVALVVVLLVTALGVIAGCSGGGGGDARVSALVPSEGTRAGGTLVRILGTNFGDGPASVLFDGVPATDVVVVSDNEITCRTPATEMSAGIDVKGVDVDVRSSGNTAHLEVGYQYINDVEPEPPNGSGTNDTLGNYQRIPIDAPFNGWIGEQGDVDVFHLHTPADGRVLIDVTWTGSYTSGGLAGIALEYYHGPEPESAPEAYYGGRITVVGSGDPGDPAPAIDDWLRMAYVNDGHGPYIVVRGVGSATHVGYDPVNSYTIHARFEPDPSFEPAPNADSFHFAQPLTAEDVTVGAAYDQDFDWYSFTPSVTGWTRITLDAGTLGVLNSANEIQLEAKLFRRDPADANVLHPVPYADAIVGDRPSSYGAVIEVASLSSASTYMLRVNNFNLPGGPTGPFTYPLKVERGDGLFEDTEPGQLGAAETPETARDLGVLSLGTPANASGYVWHWGDDDWFKVQPASTTNVTVTWDMSALRARIGDVSSTNPFGGAWGVMAFNESWFQTPGHSPIPGASLASDYVQGDGVRSITFVANATTNYYIFLDTVSGFSLDAGDGYSVSVTSP